jgi:hypothetical protein
MNTINVCMKSAGKQEKREQLFRDIKEFCSAMAVCAFIVLILGIESWVDNLL